MIYDARGNAYEEPRTIGFRREPSTCAGEDPDISLTPLPTPASDGWDGGAANAPIESRRVP